MTPDLPDRLPGPHLRGPILFLAVTIGYLALAQFVVYLNDPVNLGAGFWPAAGFTLGALVLTSPRRWGWIFAGVVVAELGGDLALGYPLDAALWWTAGNCVGPLVGATLLRRWGNPRGALAPVSQLRHFIVAAVLIGPVAGATIGTVGTVLGIGVLGVVEVWPKYVVGDSLGVLVVAPMLLAWSHRWVTRPLLEAVALMAGIMVVTLVAFHSWSTTSPTRLLYLVVPFLTWAALRFGIPGAAIAVFTVTQIANWSTATGDGPFAYAGAATGQAITQLQVFLVVIAVTTFVLAALVEDLVERAEVEVRLTRLAGTDTLTGLPNRFGAKAEVDALNQSCTRGVGIGMLACDVDNLKVVNDGLGHHAGDELLIEVSARMRRCVPPPAVVARVGGDEFLIVVEAPDAELDELAGRLLTAVARPVTLSDGSTLTPTMSVGVAHSGTDADPESLIRDADAALYRAKELGRGRSHRFDLELRERAVDRLQIQTELPDALASGELYCVYQPEIYIQSGKVFGFETLSRWEHPTRGPISPARFVPVIEDIGAAGRLFDHVLAQALDTQAMWAKHLGFHPSMAVNLSVRQLGNTDLANSVARALTRNSAPADRLWIEVTEGALAEDAGWQSLQDLHELGVRLAIDDFGTGWSSISRLAAFPWDLLKIDRSFIAALGGPNPHPEQVVRSTVAMGHALGIPTTAEGVETGEQLERLADLGCDIAQGYLFARPSDPHQAIAHITADGHWTGPGLVTGSLNADSHPHHADGSPTGWAGPAVHPPVLRRPQRTAGRVMVTRWAAEPRLRAVVAEGAAARTGGVQPPPGGDGAGVALGRHR